MRVLIVDDIVESIKGIRDHCEEQGWDCKICTFEEFGITLNEFNPDAIVLDWKDDADGENKGNSVLEDIWLTSYRPVIIFSGIATTIVLDEKYKNSNLIHIQPKGDEEPVIQYLNTIRGFVPVISALKADFNSAMIHALNSIKMISQTEYPGDNVFRYVLAKRVSTYFDKDCIDEAAPPWIQYIYPPITKTLCVCDIIRSIPTDGNLDTVGLAEEYKVLITPSCDMAQGNVSHVLCVNCYSKELFHGVELKATPSNGKIKSVTTKLNFGYKENFVSLPSIPGTLPYMTIDLKKLMFIPMEQIALNTNSIDTQVHKYCRMASIDSPYREQIVWAHMIHSCRPGLPKRNMEFWAKEILTT